ncbi:hypothetical protein L3X38_042210 [Prunus dulcis]|uniref:Uncharacterized protein n=1 Tax=Prunus dulcis TaxID=3755 RepID=A0AAD4UW61_PRUDU|nr:hypothetical protein L3X38_042210 [Prunus dulcis]
MTRASSSSNPSQVPPPAAVVLPENGKEEATVVQTSPPSISLLRPPILTGEGWFLTYFSCSRCLLGRIRSILNVGNSIHEFKFSQFWDRDSGHLRSVFGVGSRTKVAPNRCYT